MELQFHQLCAYVYKDAKIFRSEELAPSSRADLVRRVADMVGVAEVTDMVLRGGGTDWVAVSDAGALVAKRHTCSGVGAGAEEEPVMVVREETITTTAEWFSGTAAERVGDLLSEHMSRAGIVVYEALFGEGAGRFSVLGGLTDGVGGIAGAAVMLATCWAEPTLRG